MSDVRADFFGGITRPDEVFFPGPGDTAGQGGRGNQPPDQYGRPWGDPLYGVDLTPDDTGDGDTTPAAPSFNEDAFARLSAFLARAGMPGMETRLRDLVTRGIEDADAILYELRDTQEYKTRFAANTRRAAKGLPALTPDTYIQLEQQYRDLMRANGMPTGFYDQQEDFQALIENDVSPAELQARIQDGYRAVAEADPAVKQQMQRLYNVSEGQLAAYFLDPTRATPLIQREAQAARIAARAQEQAGFTLAAQTAEQLVERGITAEAAQQAFQTAGALGGLYQEMAGEEALTTEQKVGAALGFDTAAEQQLLQRQRRRLSEFQAGGGFTATTGATSYSRETGVGMAQ